MKKERKWYEGKKERGNRRGRETNEVEVRKKENWMERRKE